MRVLFKTLMAAALFLGAAAAVKPSPTAAETDRDYYFSRNHGSPEFRSRAYGPRYYGRRYYGSRAYDRGYYGRRYYRPAYDGRRYYGGYPYRY